MTEQELQPYHDRANGIAEEAWSNIDKKKVQAGKVIQGPQPAPGGILLPLSMAEKELKERLQSEAKEIREQAREKIEKEVIDRMPEGTTEKDRQLVRDGAYDILGIPPDQREQYRAKEAQPEKAPEAQRGPEDSKFYTPPAPGRDGPKEPAGYVWSNGLTRFGPATAQREPAPEPNSPEPGRNSPNYDER